jgi:catechol 2,3-dioxygenase-like lactoylglutathione lyase family enzyme
MITNISLASVFVKDIDESKRFYVDVLGFVEKDDITMGDYRWCTVTHPDQPELQVNLTVPGPPFDPETVEALRRALDGGGMNGLGLNVDDCRKTVEALKSKGVEFIQEPEERPYGVEALMRDNSGNWMVLVEPREYTSADFE